MSLSTQIDLFIFWNTRLSGFRETIKKNGPISVSVPQKGHVGMMSYMIVQTNSHIFIKITAQD